MAITKEKFNNQKKHLRNILAITGTVTTAALPTLAAPTVANAKTPSRITPAEQRLDRTDQKAVDQMVVRIEALGVQNLGVVSTDGNPGNKLTTSTFIKDVPTEYGADDGHYVFDIAARYDAQGQLIAGSTQSLTIREVAGNTVEDLLTYASLTFNKNPNTNTWESEGIYHAFNAPPGSETILKGDSLPEAGFIFNQANSLIDRAASSQPIVTLSPANS